MVRLAVKIVRYFLYGVGAVVLSIILFVLWMVSHIACLRMSSEPQPLPKRGEWLSQQAESTDCSWLQAVAAHAEQQPAVPIVGETVRGMLFPNEPANTTGIGFGIGGFRNFVSTQYPDRNLFWDAGWNFEHIFTALPEDAAINNYAPRLDPCFLTPRSERCASLFWPGENSRWGFASEMTYTATGACIDIEFRTTPVRPVSRDLVGFMWASYVQGARNPKIHFWGMDISVSDWEHRDYGKIGWSQYGFDRQTGGTVAYFGEPEFPVPVSHMDAHCINMISTDTRRFFLPFYYGLLDGDGNKTTADDTMVLIMMFDQAEPIRFAVWNINPSVEKPAWDWQYMIREPQPGTTYGYRARCIYKPFVSAEDVVREYTRWRKSLDTPSLRLDLAVTPEASGDIFPADTPGMYAPGSDVCFGVIPKSGWRIERWDGPAVSPQNRFTRVRMDADARLTAILVPTE